MTIDPYERCREAGLDDRDFRLLQMVARGRRDNYIAKQMSCTERTVGRQLAELYRKIGVAGRVPAALFYLGVATDGN